MQYISRFICLVAVIAYQKLQNTAKSTVSYVQLADPAQSLEPM